MLASAMLNLIATSLQDVSIHIYESKTKRILAKYFFVNCCFFPFLYFIHLCLCASKGQFYKTFYVHDLRMFVIS
jgi:hypothetical protein